MADLMSKNLPGRPLVAERSQLIESLNSFGQMQPCVGSTRRGN